MVIYSVFPLQFLPLKENLIAASERRLLKLNRSWHKKFSQLGQISFQLQVLSLKLIIYLFNIIIPTQCQIYILSSRLAKDLTKAKVGRKVNMEDVRRSVVIFHLLFRHRLPSTHFPWANILHLFTRPLSEVESISGNSVHLFICPFVHLSVCHHFLFRL